MDFSKGVPFDPGYSQYTTCFSTNADYLYEILNNTKNLHQKKFQFKVSLPQIKKLYDENAAFYLGCLLWATYISKKLPNKSISENPSLGTEFDEEAALFEINYIINFTGKLKKDCRYFLGQDIKIEESKVAILQTYKEFLTINEGLINTKTTNDIKLPLCIKEVSDEDLDLIFKIIEEVINSGKLSDLYSAWEKII